MAKTCPHCQQKVNVWIDTLKTCRRCGATYCTRKGCGKKLWNGCPVCKAKSNLYGLKQLVSPAANATRFILDEEEEPIGIMLETGAVERLANYVGAILHPNNPQRAEILGLLEPIQTIVDGEENKIAVILSNESWEAIASWLDESAHLPH